MKRGTPCKDRPSICYLENGSIPITCIPRQDIPEESGELEARCKSLEALRPLLRDAQAALLIPQLEMKLGVGAGIGWMPQGELAIMLVATL